ncbi:Anti-sigma regulatory factor (Ser/Thr protein kinase) [Streptomyces sp. 3213]|uniref:ATP-binding protein n=1 Tax=Streptomyces sp. 3213.3 TaxID=1855348 RepID=UPI00089648A3|nr:ATP-binding protein [Streptomyces sp. 3213.3]SED82253.1 Anti-sigma regulatory factor (Ser/Thr protein kinase) [Streptomyces sp. 3213] [Streptomyces sp. 3213.3]
MNPSEKFFRRERRSVPAARRFAHAFLAECGLAEAERGGDVLLCVSELATNALVHGVPPGRQFRVFLRYDGHAVRVEVHDSGGGVPHVDEADEGDEGGRGLLLVAALADKWGVGERDLGKVVWAEFGCEGGARPAAQPKASLPVQLPITVV